MSYDLIVREADGSLRLRYTFPADPGAAAADYRVALVTTPCHLGGRRWWFLCPLLRRGRACERRARKLYLAGRYFGCRTCHDLTYTSTQQSDSRVYRAVRTGWGPDTPDGLEGLSVQDLGFLLKVLTLQKTQAERGSGRGRRGHRRSG